MNPFKSILKKIDENSRVNGVQGSPIIQLVQQFDIQSRNIISNSLEMIQSCRKSQNVTKSLPLAIVYFILHQMVFIKKKKKKKIQKSKNPKNKLMEIVYFILHQMVFIKNQKKKSKIQKSKNQIDGNKIPGASFVLR